MQGVSATHLRGLLISLVFIVQGSSKGNRRCYAVLADVGPAYLFLAGASAGSSLPSPWRQWINERGRWDPEDRPPTVQASWRSEHPFVGPSIPKHRTYDVLCSVLHGSR